MSKKKYNVELKEQDINIIIKALSYLCVATHERAVYLYSHSLEEKFKNMIIEDEE